MLDSHDAAQRSKRGDQLITNGPRERSALRDGGPIAQGSRGLVEIADVDTRGLSMSTIRG